VDKVVQKLVALGVPGLVLAVAISMGGVAGGAAIVVALATLGGPFGMLGGIALLGLLTLIADAIASYGIEAILQAVVKGLVDKGMSPNEIRRTLRSYPITDSMRQKILGQL
jgi:hypothetical protein